MEILSNYDISSSQSSLPLILPSGKTCNSHKKLEDQPASLFIRFGEHLIKFLMVHQNASDNYNMITGATSGLEEIVAAI